MDTEKQIEFHKIKEIWSQLAVTQGKRADRGDDFYIVGGRVEKAAAGHHRQQGDDRKAGNAAAAECG